MSTFLAASFRDRWSDEDFARAVRVCRELKRQPSGDSLGSGLARAVTFARLDGDSPAVARDPVTGSWLAMCGTWHAEGDLRVDSLLEMLLDRGAAAVAARLEGGCSVVAGDTRDHSLTVITDPAGTRHTYALLDSRGAWVSSSSLVLAALAPDEALDPLGCQEYLRTGVIYEGRTLHARVRRLASGCIHRWVAGEPARVERWWDARTFCTNALHGDEAEEAYAAALERTVKRMARGRRVACDLTGGYDSRVLFAACVGAGVDVVPTVTGTPDSGDVRTAREVARAAGRELLEIPVSTPTNLQPIDDALRFGDGAYDLVELAQILVVHRTLSRDFEVSFNGTAGELCRGRHWCYALPFLTARSSRFVHRYAAVRYRDDGATPLLFPAADRFDGNAHFVGVLLREIEGWDDLPAFSRVDANYLMRMRVWQGRIATSTDQVWPTVALFLLRTMLEVGLAMGCATRFNSHTVRRYLWKRHRSLARIPLSTGYSPVPLRVETVPAFAGLPLWYLKRARRKIAREGHSGPKPQHSARGMLGNRSDVRALLEPASMASVRLFDPEMLETFLKRSTHREFPWDAQWRRLLSLERALRSVAALRGTRAASSAASDDAPVVSC